MIKRNLKLLLFTSLLILLPTIVMIFMWSSIPDQIPIHYDFYGNPDGYGSKWIFFCFPFILLLIKWAAAIEYDVRDKKEKIEDNIVSMMAWTLAMLSVLVGFITICGIKGYLSSSQRIVPAVVGAFFVVLSNNIPKYKQNKWVGLKTKWTLESKENWYKTHRLYGKIGVISGLSIIVLSLMENIHIAYLIMFVIMLASVIVPTIYSYLLYKKEKRTR